MKPLTVFCGNIGVKWDDVWVHRLRRMVEANCSVPHRFICVSDHEIPGIETLVASPVRLDPNKPNGGWVKLDYFRQDISTDGPCIALDLDVTIVGDIASLQRETLSMAHTDRKGKRHVNGSVMAWTRDALTDGIYTDNIPYDTHPRGEQEYVRDQYPQLGWLDRCYSYKSHLTPETRLHLPSDAIVIFCHGKPTPASPELLQYDWNLETWYCREIIERRTS